MSKKTLTVDLPEELSNIFIKTVTEEGGYWRGRSPNETFSGSIESAVNAALILFLQRLGRKHDLPEFREYVRRKYPKVTEDMVTMMADLIDKETGKS